MAIRRYLLTPVLLISVWIAGWLLAGSILVPSPAAVLIRLISILSVVDSLNNISVTVFRGILSLVITYALSLPAGILCGLNKKIMEAISPLVTLSQSCPPVIWIALLMIWTGMGNTVPVVVAVLTIMPVVFFSTASAVSTIDNDLFDIAKVYHIKKIRILRGIIIPAISPAIIGSLSYALGVVWKVVATAEFFGSGNGIGARLYWSFRMLDIPDLFAWSIVIIVIGFFIDTFLIRLLRERIIRPMDGGK